MGKIYIPFGMQCVYHIYVRITIHAKASASVDRVEKTGDFEYRVATRAQPEKGKANKVICALLAKHFGVAKSCVYVVAGHTAHAKIIEVEGI